VVKVEVVQGGEKLESEINQEYHEAQLKESLSLPPIGLTLNINLFTYRQYTIDLYIMHHNHYFQMFKFNRENSRVEIQIQK